MKAIIPAAGFDTTFLPVTKAQPKEMLIVYDKPIIQYVVEEALNSGIDDILIITGRNKRPIEDHFDRLNELENTLESADKYQQLKLVKDITGLADISYIRQKEQNGLGDAIYCAEKYIGDEAFAVLLGDSITKGKIPCTKQLIDVYEKYGKPTISLEEVPKEKVSRYGIVDGNKVEDNVYDIKKLVEKPSVDDIYSNLAIAGRYILTYDIFDKIEQTKHSVDGEIQLTDALQKLDSLYGVICEGKTYNIENRFEWLKASIEFAMDDENFKNDLKELFRTFI